jgi:hypothetical protein
MQGVVRPLSVVWHLDGFVGSNVRIAQKIAGRHDNVTERRDVVNGSKAVLRSLGVVRRFVTVSMERTERGEKDAYSSAISCFRSPCSPTRSRSV